MYREGLRKSLTFVRRYQRQTVIVIALLVLAGASWMASTGGHAKGTDGSHKGRASAGAEPAMKTYPFTNGGYRYSLQFYEGARMVSQGDGMQAIAKANQAIASVRPADMSVIKDCKEAGNGWGLAGHAKLKGKDVVVCGLQGNKGYAAVVEAGGTRHMVTITYLKEQKPAIIKDLQRIIGSLSVVAPGDASLRDSPV